MMTPFEFSIRSAVKDSWKLFCKAPGFFLLLSFMMVLFNFAAGDRTPHAMLGVSLIASIIVSYIWLSVSLAAVDGKYELLHVSRLREHLPTFRQFFMLIAVGLVTGLFVLVGLVALIIPGIYIMVRLMFSNLAYADRKGSVMQTLRYSWHMVRGDVFWTVLLTIFVSFGLMILGFILLGVGMLVAYPLSMLLMAKLYRALTLHHEMQAIIVQPAELSAAE